MQERAQIFHPHRLPDHDLVHQVALAGIGKVVAALLGSVQPRREFDHTRGRAGKLLQRVRDGVRSAVFVQHPSLFHSAIISHAGERATESVDRPTDS